MSNIKLDLLLIENYSTFALSLADISVYPSNYTPVSPTLQITGAGFPPVTAVFVPNSLNTYNSETLGLTEAGQELMPLSDGLYQLKYTINPATQNFVEKTIFRVYQIMEKLDTAFMKLDIMECDGPVRRQKKEELDTINYFIQGAIAAANKCANKKATKLYQKANSMLDNFITNKCNCNG